VCSRAGLSALRGCAAQTRPPKPVALLRPPLGECLCSAGRCVSACRSLPAERCASAQGGRCIPCHILHRSPLCNSDPHISLSHPQCDPSMRCDVRWRRAAVSSPSACSSGGRPGGLSSVWPGQARRLLQVRARDPAGKVLIQPYEALRTRKWCCHWHRGSALFRCGVTWPSPAPAHAALCAAAYGTVRPDTYLT
jgi:hypothetical protein